MADFSLFGGNGGRVLGSKIGALIVYSFPDDSILELAAVLVEAADVDVLVDSAEEVDSVDSLLFITYPDASEGVSDGLRGGN